MADFVQGAVPAAVGDGFVTFDTVLKVVAEVVIGAVAFGAEVDVAAIDTQTDGAAA